MRLEMNGLAQRRVGGGLQGEAHIGAAGVAKRRSENGKDAALMMLIQQENEGAGVKMPCDGRPPAK